MFFSTDFHFSYFALAHPYDDGDCAGNVMLFLNDLIHSEHVTTRSTAGDAVMWVTLYQLERRMRSLYGDNYQALPADIHCIASDMVYHRSKRELVRAICRLVEYHTRQQSECPFWAHMRIGRVTASSGFNGVSCRHRYGRHVSMKDDETCAEERKLAMLRVVDEKFMRFSQCADYGGCEEKPYLNKLCADYMQHGITHEPIHASIVSLLDPLHHGTYATSGMVLCPDMMLLGASPDLVGERGLMELKTLPSLSIRTKIMGPDDAGPTATQALAYIATSRRTGTGARDDLFVRETGQATNLGVSVFTFDRRNPVDADTGHFNVTDRMVGKPSKLRFNQRHKYAKQVLFQRYVMTQTLAMSDSVTCDKDIEQASCMKWMDCGISFLVTYDDEYIYHEKTRVRKPAFIIVFDLKHLSMIDIIETVAEYKKISSTLINSLVFPQ